MGRVSSSGIDCSKISDDFEAFAGCREQTATECKVSIAQIRVGTSESGKNLRWSWMRAGLRLRLWAQFFGNVVKFGKAEDTVGDCECDVSSDTHPTRVSEDDNTEAIVWI
jgi:hypothetical protein